MNGSKILPNLYNFLICKNIKEKVNIVFDLHLYYSSNKEKFISNVILLLNLDR